MRVNRAIGEQRELIRFSCIPVFLGEKRINHKIDLMKSNGFGRNVVKFNICLVQDLILFFFFSTKLYC